MNPLISICTITYNHADYIADALEGFLMQVTNFSFEIIVSDDCSADNTYEIVQSYALKYPELIVPKRQECNIGMNDNFIQALNLCKGKYIALCDGDDYWTDPHKLQKQVDFLEKNPDYAICFHRVSILMCGPQDSFPDYNRNTLETTTLKDLIKGNYIHTSSCVFRNHVAELPAWFPTAMPPDYFLHLTNAIRGKIRFIQDEMSVYRVHSTGLWSRASGAIKKSLIYLQTMRIFLSQLNWQLWKSEIRERYKAIKRDYLYIAIDEARSRRYILALKYFLTAVLVSPDWRSFFSNNFWMFTNAFHSILFERSRSRPTE